MGKNSFIEWTDHTFNPWWGCSKVSLACENCYAEKWSKRLGKQIWGPSSERRYFGDKHWQEPIRWNKVAIKKNRRYRVFCASMADVFEDRDDLNNCRSRLWELIKQTNRLDWLLLTKRPENIGKMVPWESSWPGNVWVGTTVENQKEAEHRLPFLLKHPSTVRFVSCEPLLGYVDLIKWLPKADDSITNRKVLPTQYPIDWVIAGGESGPRARPMHPDWVRSLRDQCSKASVPFHFKQWGVWFPLSNGAKTTAVTITMPSESGQTITLMKMTKKKAGRILDQRIWDELPNRTFE